MDIVHALVSRTLGASGRNVVLDRGFSVPIITNDGVSIARAIEVEDDVERQGVEMIKEVAIKTNTMAGDGTTTSIVLAHALVEEGMKYSDNPMDTRNSLQKAGYKVVEELKKLAKPIKDKKQILQIATLAAESEQIGKIIADTIDVIGKDGKISIEESQGTEIETKIVEGYELEKGCASPYLFNKENRAEYKDVKVLVIGDKISAITELLPFFQELSKTTKELVLFCTDIDPTVLDTLVMNKARSLFNTLLVKCASQKNEILEDIAIVTGAKFVSKASGYKLEELQMDVLGEAQRIVATSTKTIILNGKGDATQKINQLKSELPKITSDNDYDLVEARIARLKGGVAVISVGAKTETDMRYLYYKIEDAVNATKSAIEEGIVEGGGMTLYRISQQLSDTDLGEKILKKALHAPLKKIIENCGRDYTDILINMPKGKGYDAKNNCYVDLIKSGIIDPVKVERCCVENAVSFSGTFLTSDSTIALVREKATKDD